MAYSNDNLSFNTREALLYGQMQDGLHPDIMQNSAVSGPWRIETCVWQQGMKTNGNRNAETERISECSNH